MHASENTHLFINKFIFLPHHGIFCEIFIINCFIEKLVVKLLHFPHFYQYNHNSALIHEIFTMIFVHENPEGSSYQK